MERAENLARIMDVNLQFLLDFENSANSHLKEHWESLIYATGSEELFEKTYEEANSQTVTEFLTFSTENPGSIISCISSARECARVVRDQISNEMWEEINRFYLFLKSQNARQVWDGSGPYEFYKQVRENSLLFQGLTDSTFSHSYGWEFMQIGKYLERADMTSRILDVKYHILLPSVGDVGGPLDTIQWIAVLRSCSAYKAYQQIYISDFQPWKIADFLILSNEFPRSIKFCMKRINESLHKISGNADTYFSNSAEKLTGKVLSDLNYRSIDEIFAQGLHESIDAMQINFNEIGSAVYETFIAYPV